MAEPKRHWTMKKASNGYILEPYNPYGNNGDPDIYPTFEQAVEALANYFDEKAFAATVIQSQAMAAAMSQICSVAVAPKLAAIEARVNPGVENVVKTNGVDDSISF